MFLLQHDGGVEDFQYSGSGATKHRTREEIRDPITQFLYLFRCLIGLNAALLTICGCRAAAVERFGGGSAMVVDGSKLGPEANWRVSPARDDDPL